MMVFSMGEYRLNRRSAFELLVSLFIGGGFHHYGGLSCIAMSLVSFVAQENVDGFSYQVAQAFIDAISAGAGCAVIRSAFHGALGMD